MIGHLPTVTNVTLTRTDKLMTLERQTRTFGLVVRTDGQAEKVTVPRDFGETDQDWQLLDRLLSVSAESDLKVGDSHNA